MIIQPNLRCWGTNSLLIHSQQPIKDTIYARLRMLYDRASLKTSLQLAQTSSKYKPFINYDEQIGVDS